MRDVRMERRGLIRMIPACQAGFVGEVVYLGMQNRERGNVCKTLVCGERPVGRAEVMFQQSTGVSLIPFFFCGCKTRSRDMYRILQECSYETHALVKP